MTIGFIGLGIMGESMSENLINKSGETVIVFDKNPLVVEKLVNKGIFSASAVADSVDDIVKKSDIVFSMLPKNEHVQSVYAEALQAMHEDQIFVDMSTISPKVSVEISRQVAEKKGYMFDAPVVKSKAAAIAGNLGIYVGGNHEIYEQKIKILLQCMGSDIIYLGENGKGLIMKLIHNTLVGEIQNGVNEMITLVQKVGVDTRDFVTAMSYGGAQNFYLDAKHNAIIENNFTTAFSVENMHKDVHLTKELVESVNLDLPTLTHICNIYDQAMDQGIGKEDFSASFKVVNAKGNIHR